MSLNPPPGLDKADRQWAALFSGYFVFQTIYRVLMGGALGLDEAQIILDAQEFRLGYGPQLPLYAWWQRLVFLVTGSNLFGLALAKNILLCGVTLTVYFTVRTRYSPKVAGLSAAALLLLPQIGWESQRTLTHSVLVNFSAVITFAIIWRLARRPSSSVFVMLGLALAMGGLAKYNYALLPIAVLLAAATLPEIRRRVWSPMLLASLAIAGFLLYLPIQWVTENPDLAFATSQKLKLSEGGSAPLTFFHGFGAYVSAVLGFAALILVIAFILHWFFGHGDTPQRDTLERLINRTILIGLGLGLLAVVLSGTTGVRERWLQPILILMAPATMIWLVPRLSVGGIRVLQTATIAMALLIFAALPFHNMVGRAYRAAPYDKMTKDVLDGLPESTTLLASSWLSGNFFYASPQTTVINTDFRQDDLVSDGSYALIWRGTKLDAGMRYLKRRFQDQPNWSLKNHRVIRHPYRFAPDEILTFSVAQIVLLPK